eukprot:3342687-Pleurochrysis_carterae.AAC.1
MRCLPRDCKRHSLSLCLLDVEKPLSTVDQRGDVRTYAIIALPGTCNRARACAREKSVILSLWGLAQKVTVATRW